MYRAGVTLLVVAVVSFGRWDSVTVATTIRVGWWYEPQVKMAYIYEHNDTNLTIFCNTTAYDSPFLASGMMIVLPHRTQFLTRKVNYSEDMENIKQNYTHQLTHMLTGEPGTYVNGSVTCWGSNGTFGAGTFIVRSMVNKTAGNTNTSIHFVEDSELVENPAYFRRSDHRAFMIVILTQVVFVVFIINASFIWSWTFKRHKR
ncbi:membrane protein UL120 [Human betaherpesvirus 5]|uniref:Membrane protein UL120 n=1 Tax=Human cytomegalovirus TaxID=10359 RepID=C8BLI8_HCMV|nr:membrane protein UL120 [Human betaherpesvirus 5]ACZ81660.1 membrane protein UL120 [Human betaherpesvirus 5]ADB84767.1 membrane protein UL120 [Human betaherpesvirus 5]AFR55093.1 membrane protein UL120 [Human betaherpesvirus 5]AFR55930.1 membrane protein UL120 [Human betaherpesvirus 5]